MYSKPRMLKSTFYPQGIEATTSSNVDTSELSELTEAEPSSRSGRESLASLENLPSCSGSTSRAFVASLETENYFLIRSNIGRQRVFNKEPAACRCVLKYPAPFKNRSVSRIPSFENKKK